MSEILLPTSEDLSAVCCLSSVNAEFFDDWKDNDLFIEDLIRFLDNVLEYFIIHANKKYMSKAIRSSKRQRNIGLGCMGLYSYFQKNMIPYESALAVSRSKVIAQTIHNKALNASMKLALERGEPSDIEGSGMRHANLIAIAPNASTSIILGTSPSIEPLRANVFIHKTDKGINIVRNRYLKALLKERYEGDYEKVELSILKNQGSVQHLDRLTEEEKEVFKTAIELNQNWVIEHALIRQPYIDQGQSVNLFFPANVDISYVHQVHWRAVKNGLKTLYYLRSEPIGKVKINPTEGGCLSCEG